MLKEQTKYYKACVEILDTIYFRNVDVYDVIKTKNMAKTVFHGIIIAGSELAMNHTVKDILYKMG
ncbi:hypothetical protein [Roseburia faecis]|uniref:hypothetical protein n=1 Tax=Roseburia faecis TaxID=301302 RepID=UPI003F9E9BC9